MSKIQLSIAQIMEFESHILIYRYPDRNNNHYGVSTFI
jgi:hypothetical protein